MATLPRTLSEEQQMFYRTNGYLLAGQVVPEQFLAGVQALLEELVDEQIAEWKDAALISESYADLGFGRRYHQAWLSAGRPRVVTSDDERFVTRALDDHLSQDWLVDLAASLLDRERAFALRNCFYRAKFPDDQTSNLPWHQDAQCLEPLSGLDFVTAWIPLVDVSEQNSCLEVSPIGDAQKMFDATWSPESGYVCMVESDAAALTTIHPVRMRRGDVLFLSPYAPHRSLANRDAQIRWSIDLRYAPA